MLFITLVAFSAIFVASCAAFFSIKGLITLFSGSSLAIGIMASSLELGKLVAASFLHTYWRRINFLLKLYLSSAVLVLMCITSLGIFGFLTGAYQVHSSKVNTFDTKIASLTLEKQGVDQSILERTDRIKTLVDLRQTQEQRIQAAGNLKAPREQAYKSIAEANEEIHKKETEVAQDRQRATELDKEISELKISLNTTTDVGSFKFIADAIGTDVDTSVQYFIFALIAVFDPLAVALVLAWNKLIEHRAASKKEEEEQFESSLRELTPIQPESRSIVIQESKEPVKVPAPIAFEPPIEKVIVDKLEEPASTEPVIAVIPPVPEPAPAPSIYTAPEPAVQDDVAKDMVSEMPIADLSEEAQYLRRKLAGKNNSVITK
jgi:cell division protein FtsL